jgi:hypothetical protein
MRTASWRGGRDFSSGKWVTLDVIPYHAETGKVAHSLDASFIGINSCVDPASLPLAKSGKLACDAAESHE